MLQNQARNDHSTDAKNAAHLPAASNQEAALVPENPLNTLFATGRPDAAAHARAFTRLSQSQPSRASQSLLSMQRMHGNRYVQRVLAISRQGQGEGEVTPAVEAAIERSRGGGAALETGTRRQMESAFGADFSSVRIHTGAESHSLNRAVSAVAFTTGNDLFFRDGAYDPSSAAGKQLLAHELTHVVQQGGSPIQGKLVVGPANDVYEQEADQVGRSVMASLNQGGAAESVAGPATPIQRQCACGGRGGECAECRAKREAVQRYAESSRAMQRRTVCPPGVSPENGTGCTSVPDDDTADAGQNALPAPTTSVMQDPTPIGPPAPTPDAGTSTAAPAAAAPTAQPGDVPIANLPGTDYDSCVDQTDEDTARLIDTINTACSVKGAAFALAGGVAGGFAGPVGAGIGAVAGGIYGAYNYGKCVEEQNASARVGAKKQKAQCAQKFKH